MTFTDRARAEAERITMYTPEREHNWLFEEGARYGYTEGRADALADPTDAEVLDALNAVDAQHRSLCGLPPSVGGATLDDWTPVAIGRMRCALAAFLAGRRSE